jgi:hypothetical protein
MTLSKRTDIQLKPTIALSIMRLSPWKDQHPRRLPLPRLGSPVVLLRRADARVPGQLLSHRDISACIEQVTDERAPLVMR